MDLSKVKKPLHITCPHCRRELDLCASDVERRYQSLKSEIAEMKAQIDLFNSEYREDYKTNDWFRRVRQRYAYKLEEYVAVKQERQNLIEYAEREAYKAFKQIVKDNVGEETFMLWMEQAEKEIQYHTYETAINRDSKPMSKPIDG